MRGLAIFFIIFHNYFHLFNVFVRENQFTFFPGNTTVFFNRLISGSPWWLCDIFSYLGWYGICTFIFLSGYGLVQKYELGPDSSSFSPSTFIHNNWLKLLNLLLPAVAILLIIWGFSASGENGQTLRHIADTLILPSFLNDPLLPLTSVSPGVYWYFGLTLELYIVYALAVHSRPPRVLAILVSFTIVLQIVVGYFWPLQPYGLEWVRHNFTGWLLVFAFGISLCPPPIHIHTSDNNTHSPGRRHLHSGHVQRHIVATHPYMRRHPGHHRSPGVGPNPAVAHAVGMDRPTQRLPLRGPSAGAHRFL